MRESLVFYRSFFEAIEMLDEKEQLEAYKNIVNYGLNGILPKGKGAAVAIFNMSKPQIDVNIKRYENSKKGGRNAYQSETKIKPNANQTLTKVQPNVNVNVNVNDNVNVKEKNKKEKPVRNQYGEYKNVLLSDQDMEKLKNQFPNDYQQRIDNLSGYMKSTGKSYTDHLATIRNWARRDDYQKSAAGQKANDGMIKNNTIDFNDLEKKLLGGE